MSAVWYKILLAIDQRNQVIEARDATIDVEVKNMDDLLTELKIIRDNWFSIFEESKSVAEALNIDTQFPVFRKLKKVKFSDMYDSGTAEKNSQITGEEKFQSVFHQIIDSVRDGLDKRYKAAYRINALFQFLWRYLEMSEENVISECNKFEIMYGDVSEKELRDEILHLKKIHNANFCDNSLNPLSLLNTILRMKLEGIFPNTCIALRIFLTLPVTIVTAERSFSKLKLIKNYLRSTMSQSRLVDLALLSIESELARTIDFNSVIDNFATIKARRGCF